MRYARIPSVDVEIVVADSPEEASVAAAAVLADAAAAGGAIALAGGSTPRRAYELAAAGHPDWAGVDVWLTDERCVPEEDERSNLRLVRESLLAGLRHPPAVHAVPTDLPPAAAARAYDAALHALDGAFRLALLGLGVDGHTASLYPHAPGLAEGERLAVATDPGLPPWVERVTLTIPALAASAHVVFLAVGADKAAAARAAFRGAPSPATPASLVRSAAGRTTAILDAAAAAAL